MRPTVVVMLGAVLASAAVSVPVSAADAERPGRLEAKVTSIVDGDTIHVDVDGHGTVSGPQKVRFIGIDTPETHNPSVARECFGVKATRRLTRLIPPGTRVRLALDVDMFDRYERLLAYVYRRRDGLFVNAALVRDGYAAAYTVPPDVAHAEELRRLQRRALEAGRRAVVGVRRPDEPA